MLLKLWHDFIAIGEFKLELQSTPNLGQIRRFLEPCDLKFDVTLKNNRAPPLRYFKLCASLYSHLYIQMGYSPETPNLQIRRFLEPCDLEIWRMTLKNNMAPLLCCFQLVAWFHSVISNGVRVQTAKLGIDLVTLTFHLYLLHGHHFWPW